MDQYGNLIETVRTRDEWTFTWDGEPQTSPVMASRQEVEEYIEAGVKAGNDRERYGIAFREVVVVSTQWRVAQ